MTELVQIDQQIFRADVVEDVQQEPLGIAERPCEPRKAVPQTVYEGRPASDAPL